MPELIEPHALQLVFDRAVRDRLYRQKLQQNPHLAIKDASGVWVSTMLRIRFVEKDPDVDVMIVLPDLQVDGEGHGELPAATRAQTPTRTARADAPAVPRTGDETTIDERAITLDAVRGARTFADREALMRACPAWCPPSGLILEFGVFQGDSLRCLREAFGATVVGYDSFEGLPEDWERARGRFLPAGYFRCRRPNVDGAELVVGLFDETVAGDLASRAQPIRFAHIDCDLYGSAMAVLQAIKPWLQTGTVLLFDELVAFETSAYQNWKQGEWRALQESGITCRPLGRTRHTQCALEVVSWT